MAKEKDRIIALQKQLKLAREALQRIVLNDNRACTIADEALEKMDQIQWASKPNLIQDKLIRRDLVRNRI